MDGGDLQETEDLVAIMERFEGMEFVEFICAVAAARCEERDDICRCDPYLESCR